MKIFITHSNISLTSSFRVAVRTLLAYFLSREVNEVLELLEKGRKDNEDGTKEKEQEPKDRKRSPAKEE